jgi:hypothetical protein
MPRKRNITIGWVQVATKGLSLSEICKRPPYEKKASNQKQDNGPEGQEIGHLPMGLTMMREQGN